jgi:tetratricopeptide (TPR) repeat protein
MAEFATYGVNSDMTWQVLDSEPSVGLTIVFCGLPRLGQQTDRGSKCVELVATVLNLIVADYKDANYWYWRLTDAGGQFLADQEVDLNPRDSEYEGFLDLPRYLAMHAVPDRRREDETRLAHQVGAWMGKHFYGPIGDKILAAGTPAVVSVQVPAEAEGLLYRPWELGHVQGQPLAMQDVSLIFEVPGDTATVKRVPVGKRLRILAVFSLPVDANALNLRQERYELSRTIRAIGRQNRAIDLRVLQYGVTREALKKVLEDGEGWDIVHFSGHGLAAHLVLEKADGKFDMVPSDELVKLLRPARGRLKWVTLSACLSAAATVEETRLWLGLDPQRAGAAVTGNQKLQTVARALVQSLDCAVLAMRYPVGDQFAIDLGRKLFERVLDQKQSLTRALQVTLPELIEGPDVVGVATPTLFGRHAADLDVSPPPGEPQVRLELSYFPREPERFVGRVGLLTHARGALAPDSKPAGVLFHGMSGGGKTACALELAWQYEGVDRFQHFVWFKAPPEGHDISAALINFAGQWDLQLDSPEVSLVAIANNDEATFAGLLPRLTRFLAQRSVLIVLDNLESLLRPNGNWRDTRWEKLIAAMLDHRGQSRLVVTSRVRPEPRDSRLPALSVHSLSLNEAALLARQSPNLGALLRDEAHRPLVVETLKLVQGHPKLLELAEAQASSPERLAQHLARAAAAGSAQLEAFFKTGESSLDAGEFLATLSAWTKTVSEALPEPARNLFHRLCCLEEGDRREGVIKTIWADKASALPALVEAGLVDAAYHIHPGVAESGREQAGQELRSEVDAGLSVFWITVFRQAEAKEESGMGDLVLHAGRSAAPYLMRRCRWSAAQVLMDAVINRDNSPTTVSEVLPLLQRIAEETEGTAGGLGAAASFGNALKAAGRVGEAEAIFRKVEQQAATAEQYQLASAVAGPLIDLLRKQGRLAEALQTVESKKSHTRQAGLGPWTQLSDEGLRLQILNDAGRHEDVLAAAQKWREEIRNWPDVSAEVETADPWQVKETLWDVAGYSAVGLERWLDALSLNEELAKVQVSRSATQVEVARTRYNDYGPLLRLRRYDDARSLLSHCFDVFQSAGNNSEVGRVQSAFADLEDKLQHHEEAVRHENAALRYSYAIFRPGDSAVSHFNLTNYLRRTNAAARTWLAHRLASTLILYQTNEGRLPNSIEALRYELTQAGPGDLPANFDELCKIVEQTEGVRFRELFNRLPKRAATGDEALQRVLEMARTP